MFNTTNNELPYAHIDATLTHFDKMSAIKYLGLTVILLCIWSIAVICNSPLDMTSRRFGVKSVIVDTPPDTTKRPFGIKSGILTSRKSEFPGGIVTLYFDDYGAKQAEYSAIESGHMGLSTLEIRMDGHTTSIDLRRKVGRRTKNDSVFRGIRNLSDVDSSTRLALNFRAIEDRTVVDQVCKGYQIEQYGIVQKIWVYEGITMYTESNFSTEPWVTEVTSLTIVDVPKDKFEIPPDVKIEVDPFYPLPHEQLVAAKPTAGVRSGVVEIKVRGLEDIGDLFQSTAIDTVKPTFSVMFFFDDYGKKQALHFNADKGEKKLRSVQLFTDGWITDYDAVKETGSRYRAKGIQTAGLIIFPSLLSDSLWKTLRVVAKFGVDAAGKHCTCYDLRDVAQIRLCIHNGIPLFFVGTFGGYEAISVTENVDVPAEKFTVPPNVKIVEKSTKFGSELSQPKKTRKRVRR